MSRKVVLYIAMSLDGYIAGPNDDLGFLSLVERPGEDYGYAEFTAQVDTIIWGRKTYDKVRTMAPEVPYADKKVYVVSRSRTGAEGHVEFHPDVVSLVMMLKEQEGKIIYCDGGAEIVHTLLQHQLIDRMIVSIIPHLVGDGVQLFKDGRTPGNLSLKRTSSYPSGLVQVDYEVVR